MSLIDEDRVHRRRQRSAALRQLGPQLSPAMIEETRRVCAAELPAGLWDGVDVTRDLAYGQHERHVLDVYTGEDARPARPIVLFVHGGGFVAGSKGDASSPFGPNVGAWAARQGFVGAVMNYRLAPEASWPDGADDIALAVEWLRAHAGRFEGDAACLFVFGQSAGAMHVADFLGRGRRTPTPPIAGAVLFSCLYDVGTAADLPIHRAYWGDDREAWRHMGSVQTIVEAEVPLLLGIAEYDEPQFARHAVTLTDAWFERRGTFPPMVCFAGHNHLSTVFSLGSEDDVVSAVLRDFVLDNSSP